MKKVILLILIALPLFANAQFVKISQKQINLDSPSFTGIPETPDLLGSNPNQVVNQTSLFEALSTKISTTGDENFSGVKIASNSSEPNTAGFLLNNNFNGGVSSHTNAPFRIENNQNGIGAHIWNKTSGIATYYLGYGSGTLTYYNRSSGSTGDYISLNAEGVNISKIDYLGNFFTSGKLTWGGGSFTSGDSQLYNEGINGTVLVSKSGATNDFLLTNGIGQGALSVPHNTQDIVLNNNLKVSGLSGTITEVVHVDLDGNLIKGGAAPTSGAYTPTVTASTNVTSATLGTASYTKIGNIVTGAVSINMQATAINLLSEITITSPVNRAAVVPNYYVGTGAYLTNTDFGAGNAFFSGSSASTITLRFNSGASVASSGNCVFTFQYDITK